MAYSRHYGPYSKKTGSGSSSESRKKAINDLTKKLVEERDKSPYREIVEDQEHDDNNPAYVVPIKVESDHIIPIKRKLSEPPVDNDYPRSPYVGGGIRGRSGKIRYISPDTYTPAARREALEPLYRRVDIDVREEFEKALEEARKALEKEAERAALEARKALEEARSGTYKRTVTIRNTETPLTEKQWLDIYSRARKADDKKAREMEPQVTRALKRLSLNMDQNELKIILLLSEMHSDYVRRWLNDHEEIIPALMKDWYNHRDEEIDL